MSADTVPSTCILRWGAIGTPGGFPQRNDVIASFEINSIAASAEGTVIYVTDVAGPNSGIWKSADGGITWSRRPTSHLAQALPPPVFPVAEIAVSPDDPAFIAALCMDSAGTHRREVYISEDGGTNWTYSGPVPWIFGASEQAGSIVISAAYAAKGWSIHDIIIGSRNPADGLGQGEIYLLNYPGLSGWKAQGFRNGDIITLALPGCYAADGSIVVMSSTTQRTYINLGFHDFAANTCNWNNLANWPVELCEAGQSGGTSSGENTVITGSLSLPIDFQALSAGSCIIFAAYDSNGAALGAGRSLDDVYRVDEKCVTRLKAPGNNCKPRITSIAYSGNTTRGNLLVGSATADAATAVSTIWYTDDPFSRAPCWSNPLKSPTGGYSSGYANVKLSCAEDGKTAFCGTGSGNLDTPLKWSDPTGPAWASVSLDESAFSVSRDNGISWNQLGLIDTAVNRLMAVEASPDDHTLYLASVNNKGLDSLWRSRSPVRGEIWERVLCIDCSMPLLKLAPDIKDGSVVFLGCQKGTRISQSRDLGNTWQECLPGATLQDMAAADSNNLFILQLEGLVRRGIYETGGWQWKKFTDCGLDLAHTITVLNNNILVGAALGQSYPATFSSDWGDNWILITRPSYSSGNCHLAFDDNFKDNRIIYLADDAGGLYRWSVGTSNRWDDMAPPHHSYYGIAALARDTLYAAYSPGSNGIDRTLYSRAGIPKSGMSWDSLSTGLNSGVLFRQEPCALVCHSNTIWAIDSRNYSPLTGIGLLWAFKDTLAAQGPWLISPKAGNLIGCDPVSGRNAQVDLKWEQLSLADSYEIEIGKDKWFDLPITGAAPASNPFFSPNDLVYPAYYISPGLLPEAGRTYFWHVRVRKAVTGQSIRSPWSYALSFNVSPGYPVVERISPAVETASPSHGLSSSPNPATYQPSQPTKEGITNALLATLICVILFALTVQVILYYRRNS